MRVLIFKRHDEEDFLVFDNDSELFADVVVKMESKRLVANFLAKEIIKLDYDTTVRWKKRKEVEFEGTTLLKQFKRLTNYN